MQDFDLSFLPITRPEDHGCKRLPYCQTRRRKVTDEGDWVVTDQASGTAGMNCWSGPIRRGAPPSLSGANYGDVVVSVLPGDSPGMKLLSWPRL